MAHDDVDIGEKAYEAQFEARRLASLKEAARGLGYTLPRSLSQQDEFQVGRFEQRHHERRAGGSRAP